MLFVGQVLAFTEVESDSVSFIWAPCRIIEWINIQARPRPIARSGLG
jgi:hypothetical protein